MPVVVDDSTQRASAAGGDVIAVGRSWRRTEAEAKVRGTHRYVADMPAPPGLHVAVQRSNRPHALIASIDAGESLARPGVEAVITGSELFERLGPRMFTGPAFSDQPPLAHERVRYVGEPVAAVVAQDLATARAAADLVRVTYDDLEPVFDVSDALSGRAFVHEELKPSSLFGDLRHLEGARDTNVCYEFNLRRGDAERRAAEAETSYSAEFWCPPTQHVCIELPHTAAWPDGDRLEILTTTQTPSYVRQMAAEMLDLPLSKVRVRTGHLGGGFGSKMYDRLEPLAAALAWILQDPVRVAVTREESFLLTTRHGAGVTGTMGTDAGGNLVSSIADVVYDTGAYADIGPRIASKSGMMAAGPYRVGDAAIRSRCVYTNKPSAGPYRGFGVPQVTWFHESMVDELARARGEDPVEFRRRNLLREGDVSHIGTPMHSANFVGCLDAVAEALEWRSPLGRGTGRWRRGRGIAVGVKAVLTPTVANAVLQLNQDGSASLLISTVDMGQGSDTIMSQIVGEVLQLPEGTVRIVPPDSDVTPYDTITAG
ncbi:MAG: xanthine dehydrogenase family protein molybdopterin-binding subunit, partial [Actinomycetota bacterium]